MTLSSTLLRVTLPSGNAAVYEVQPQHMNLQHWGASLNQSAIEFGRQLAHELDGRWFKPGGWDEITDPRTIELLEQCADANTPAVRFLPADDTEGGAL